MLYVGIILKLYYYLYWLLISKERYFNKANLCEVFVFKLYELDRYFTCRMGICVYTRKTDSKIF